jgi:hypothetical protein
MSNEPEPLFREEALEYLARHGGPGELLRVSSRWTTAAFWLLLALVAVGVALALVVQIQDESLLQVLLRHL